MKVYFCRSNTLGGWLIRLLTASNWNHVAIEVGGVVYEALASTGVIKTPVHLYKIRDGTETVVLPGTPSVATQWYLEQQVGRPYDWFALVAMPFRARWQRPHKWFCSELVTKALAVSGVAIMGRVPHARVTPRDLWFALPEGVT